MELDKNDKEAIIIVSVVIGVVVLIIGYYFYRRSKTSAAAAALLSGVTTSAPLPAQPNGGSSTQAPLSPYKIKKRLGDGAYGTVYLATRRADHTPVALKVIACKDEKEAKESMKEYTMCMEVQGHENIVKVYDVFFDTPVSVDGATSGGASQAADGVRIHVGSGYGGTATTTPHNTPTATTPLNSQVIENTCLLALLGIRCPAAEKYLCIVSEYCEEGTLFDLLLSIRNANRQGRRERRIGAGLDEALLWSYAQQLLDAIAFLHSKSLMHRDLKPSNVLLADNHRRLLLTDFGLSRFVEAHEYAQTRTGTLQYMSPEQVQRRYNSKGDVWGIGCLVHAMATAKVSTSEARIMFRDRAKPDFEAMMRTEELKGYSSDLVEFMLFLLTYRYQERPTAQEAAERCRAVQQRIGHCPAIPPSLS